VIHFYNVSIFYNFQLLTRLPLLFSLISIYQTIGDSYVAVTGLPDPRKDHAVVMVKFARDCRQQFNELCSILESSLGPETGDLLLRIGIHSGPVTAGVLRGQKSRFQLFGDT
jgi:class 3 adenylate cyclase